MTTEKLYEQDPYLCAFTARVLDCSPAGDRWAVVLDRTAFYPEGGGQPGDQGSLDAVPVLDTRFQGETLLHLCQEPLPVGAEVRGQIDWDRRFDRMQQHSGEHIVSGLLCARFGCNNVGFHMGAETVVIDFDCTMDWDALMEIELEANRVIWENRPFRISWPAPEALEALTYRSKKALSGPVRIVECPGADCCACCGTHVRAAGELGLIKLLRMKPFRAGVRIEMVAGSRAYRHISVAVEQNDQISTLLSAKVGETASAVEQLQAALSQTRYRLVGLEDRLFQDRAAALAGQGDVLLFEAELEPEALRRCCDAVAARCGGRCALFAGADGTGYRYAMAWPGGDLRPLTQALHETLGGRGGGKPALTQGAVPADRSAIEAFFAAMQAP